MAAVQDSNRTATLFCRVSSSKQANNYSPEAQERLGREYASQQGLTITRVFQVVETASKKAKRQKWAEYLEYVRRGPEKHALVATVDRALRNFADLPEVSELQKKYRKTVHFFLEGLVLDGAHASTTDLRLGISAAVAVWYAGELAEKTRRGIDQKALKGEWPNHAPFGYLNDKTSKRLIIDPDKARWVKRIKELSAEARHSLDSIVDQILAEGCTLYGRRIHRTLIERTIRNPIYTGRFDWPPGSGNWIQGTHEPIVSWELHQAAVAGLERKTRSRQRKHDFVLAGMIRCGSCPQSRSIVFEIKKGRFVYGHCAGNRCITINGVKVPACPKAEFVRLETIEEQLMGALESIYISEAQAQHVLDLLSKEAGPGQARNETQMAILRGQMTKLEERMAKAYTDKLDGKVDEDFWSEQQKRWGDEKVRIQEALRRIESEGPSSVISNARKVLELAKNIVPAYKSAKAWEKRGILNFVCSNLKLTGKKLDVTMKTPFDLLAEGRVSGKWLRA